MSVSTGEADTQIISGIGFDQSVVDKVSLLKKGDSLAVVGSLKQTEWQDKATNETKHGLSITANQSLSIFDIKKRRKPAPEPDQAGKPSHGDQDMPFDDPLSF
jgi:single-stranded DNA-binding protein